MLKYILPSVGQDVKLQRHCPYCHRFGASKHSGIIHRAISDMRVTSIRQRRMKCPWCKATWTLRPEGIGDGRHRTDRMIA
jgi:transposase-like protein